MKKLLTILVGCLFCYGPVGFGMDLLKVYSLAVEHDPDLREVRERMYAAKESRPQALAQLLPNVNVQGSYDYVDDKLNSNPLSPDRYDNFTQNQLGVTLDQPIYHRDFWIQLKQSDDTIAQAEAEYASAQIDLMLRSANAYFNVLRRADDLRVRIAEREANARQLEQSRQRFDVGLIAITDVHESKAAFDQARADEIAAENDLNNAWEALWKIIGTIDEPVAKLGVEMPLNPPQPDNIEKWAETAQSQNYSIIAARESAEFARKGIEVQNSGHYPTFDLVGSYTGFRNNSDFSSNRDRGIVGVEMNLPIYQGGGVTSRTRQARYDYQAAMEVLDQQRRAVNQTVRDAYRGVISSISRVEALKSTVVSTRSALESTQAGLEVGTRTMVDVLTVQGRMYESERDYSNSRYDYIINGLALHQAASTLSKELLTKVNEWLVPKETVPPPR